MGSRHSSASSQAAQCQRHRQQHRDQRGQRRCGGISRVTMLMMSARTIASPAADSCARRASVDRAHLLGELAHLGAVGQADGREHQHEAALALVDAQELPAHARRAGRRRSNGLAATILLSSSKRPARSGRPGRRASPWPALRRWTRRIGLLLRLLLGHQIVQRGDEVDGRGRRRAASCGGCSSATTARSLCGVGGQHHHRRLRIPQHLLVLLVEHERGQAVVLQRGEVVVEAARCGR